LEYTDPEYTFRPSVDQGANMEKSLSTAAHRRLAELLRTLREEAGVTQVELAARVGETQSAVSKVENGQRRLDLVQLATYCSAIGCDLRELVERWEREASATAAKAKRNRKRR
jgi:transcriptional regulator with XRE-family HTH domain